jgi:hypothetical protein
MACGGKFVKQAAETDEVDPARAIGQRRVLFAEVVDPAEQVGITTQFGELEQLREIRLEIGEEAMGGRSIVSVGGRKSPDVGVEDLLEFLVGQSGGWERSHRV